MDFVIGFCRYVLPILTFVILFKCFQTLLIGHPINKTYGYIIDKRTGDKIPLNTWETSIGRSKSCDITLAYGDVSRFHAVICRRVDGWYLFDTLSKIGTLVNGEKIEKGITIKHRDEISFASNVFVFAVTDDPVIQVGKRKKKKRRKEKREETDISYEENADYYESFAEKESPETYSYTPPQEPFIADMGSYYIDFHPSAKRRDTENFAGEDVFSGSLEPTEKEVFTESAFDDGSAVPEISEDHTLSEKQTQPVLHGLSDGRSFSLCASGIVIGRSRSSDIRINAGNISRNHAILTRKNGIWYVSDTNSSFGTFVNGRRITSTTALRDGDIIRFSDMEYKFTH